MAEMERNSVHIVRHFSVLVKTSEVEILFTFLSIFSAGKFRTKAFKSVIFVVRYTGTSGRAPRNRVTVKR